jgi:hypothetical protein
MDLISLREKTLTDNKISSVIIEYHIPWQSAHSLYDKALRTKAEGKRERITERTLTTSLLSPYPTRAATTSPTATLVGSKR